MCPAHFWHKAKRTYCCSSIKEQTAKAVCGEVCPCGVTAPTISPPTSLPVGTDFQKKFVSNSYRHELPKSRFATTYRNAFAGRYVRVCGSAEVLYVEECLGVARSSGTAQRRKKMFWYSVSSKRNFLPRDMTIQTNRAQNELRDRVPQHTVRDAFSVITRHYFLMSDGSPYYGSLIIVQAAVFLFLACLLHKIH